MILYINKLNNKVSEEIEELHGMKESLECYDSPRSTAHVVTPINKIKLYIYIYISFLGSTKEILKIGLTLLVDVTAKIPSRGKTSGFKSCGGCHPHQPASYMHIAPIEQNFCLQQQHLSGKFLE